MSPTLYYVYDPLCGWCYGATGALNALAEPSEIRLQILPSGLFSGPGARAMDASFAAYAWSNDQRIERLTGQGFSEQYRNKVLSDHLQRFDSGPATSALSAVASEAPEREVEALKAMQKARYIDGQDITQTATLQNILTLLGLNAAAARLPRPDSALLEANQQRVNRAQALLQAFDARGVPTFILEREGQRQLLNAGSAFSHPQAFVKQLLAA